jgi:hypothetical protein
MSNTIGPWLLTTNRLRAKLTTVRPAQRIHVLDGVERAQDVAPAVARSSASGLSAIRNALTYPDQCSASVAVLPWIVE